MKLLLYFLVLMKQLISLLSKLVFHLFTPLPFTLNLLPKLPYLFFVFIKAAFLCFLRLELLNCILHQSQSLCIHVYGSRLLFKITKESVSLRLECMHELLLLIQGCHILIHHKLSLTLLLAQKLISLGVKGLKGQRML